MNKNFKPIVIAQIYLSFVLVLFLFGPLKWRLNYPFITVGFLILGQVFLFMGYLVSMKKNRINIQKRNKENNLPLPYLSIIIIFTFIMNLFTIFIRHGLLDISTISRILSNFGEVSSSLYNNKINSNSSSLFTMFSTLTAPISYLGIPLTLYNFSKLKFRLKLIGIMNILLECLKWLLIGTNKGLIDLFLMFIAIYYLKRENIKRNNIAVKILLVTLATLVLLIFSVNISSRIGQNIYVLSNITNGTKIDFQGSFFQWVPESLKYLIIYIAIYLTQGFYAIDLAFQVNFIPMFGIGNSNFLIEKFQGIFGTNFFQYTYQSRLESIGWSSTVNWHSVYLWFANDISLLGIFPLMFLAGYYFYFVTYQAIITKKAVYIGLFCLMVQFIFYIPMNNQVLSYPSSFMAFIIYNLSVLINKRKKVRKNMYA
ncbi:O-antigen polymerase [Enterococcus durans]|uniref:O-antigen polymerase n=1 Tax=Enterococcus durans TaxID=53345 RepID=UPI00115A92A0|nr:O-antigen polymerase [Enterococcus durans]MCG3447935.1 oligosaccharide repeat unit polymerase [Enterococcus durans]